MIIVSLKQIQQYKALVQKYNVDTTKVNEQTLRRIALAVKNNKWNSLEIILQKVGG
jgi:hypothetical protein